MEYSLIFLLKARGRNKNEELMMRAEDEAVSWVSTLSTQGVKVLAVLTHFVSLFPKMSNSHSLNQTPFKIVLFLMLIEVVRLNTTPSDPQTLRNVAL